MSEKLDTRRSVALAEMKDTNSSDYQACVADMKRHAGVDEGTAKLIAAAFRAKALPKIARKFGIEEEEIKPLLKQKGDLEEEEFAEDEATNDEVDTKDLEEIPEDEVEDEDLEEDIDEDDEDEDLDEEVEFDEDDEDEEDEDLDEEEIDTDDMDTEDESDEKGLAPKEEGMAHVEMDFPIEMLSDLKEALRDVVGNEVDSMFPDEIGDNAPILDEGEQPMTKKQLAARRAARQAILTRTAQAEPKSIGLGRDNIVPNTSVRTPENKTSRIRSKDIGLGRDTSFNGKPYTFAGESQPSGEVEYPALTMENSSGNSLLDQNPTYNRVKVYTTNPDLLQLKDAYAEERFDTSANSLSLDPDFDEMLPIPSDAKAKDGPYTASKDDFWAVPTQMGNKLPKHNTNAPMVSTASRECMGCNNPSRRVVNYVECSDCNARIAICEDCEDQNYCPSCAANVRTSADVSVPVNFNIEPVASEDEYDEYDEYGNKLPEYDKFGNEIKKPEYNDVDETDEFNDGPAADGVSEAQVINKARRAMELYKARAKCAYKHSATLAAAGVIDVEGIEQNAEMWLQDGLSVQSMTNQAKLILRSASTATQRVVSNERTASISFNPTPSTNSHLDNSVTDMKQALRGLLWTTPEQYSNK